MRTIWVWVLAALVFGVVAMGTAEEESLQVVLHESGQGQAGNGEWVELLVVGTGPGSTVDMRGWVFHDQQGTSRGGVYVTFTDHILWSAVPAGTLIVFYNADDKPSLPPHFPEDNVDPSDFVLKFFPPSAETTSCLLSGVGSETAGIHSCSATLTRGS